MNDFRCGLSSTWRASATSSQGELRAVDGSTVSHWSSHSFYLRLAPRHHLVQTIVRETMQRVTVIGTSCSGKTSFAKRLACALNCQHIELDAIHWGPNWTERPPDQVRSDVNQLTTANTWVSCGNYGYLRDIVWTRADTIIWLNYHFPIIWYRALRRTFRRSLGYEKMWHGNRETLRRAFLSRDSILLWVLKTYGGRRRTYPKLLARPENAHLEQFVFHHPREAEKFLASLECV
ncbi:MAG: hypothetical protein R3B91_22270 [Planctomycetaceae bacterium]